MAKVRIQARSADVEEAQEEHIALPQHNRPHHKTGHHVGALTVLERIWRRNGFLGWYQVRRALSLSALSSKHGAHLVWGHAGYGRAAGEGGDHAGAAVHVEGPVRALGAGDHGLAVAAAGREVMICG